MNDDDRIVERLRALADHARTEPTRELDELATVVPFRPSGPSSGRRWAVRASVGAGLAAAVVAMVLAVRGPSGGDPGDLAGPTTTRAIASAPVPTRPPTTAAAPTSAGAPPTVPATVTTVVDVAATSTTGAATTTSVAPTSDVPTTVPETPTATSDAAAPAVPDGAFLATVAAVDGTDVTWNVRCGVAVDGGPIGRATVSLPMVATTVTADTGAEGTSGSVEVAADTWRSSRTSGSWWVTVRGGRVTAVVAATLAPARCV